MSEIRTARLHLRRARWSDLEAMHVVLSDAKAMRYWSSLPHDGLDRTREWLASMIEAPPEASDDYVIELDGKVIGKAGCWRLPEVGFIIGSDHWRQGYGREALAAALDAIFRRHPIDAVTADVDPRNAASLGLLRSLGFVETGRAERTFRLGEQWCDSVYLALPRGRFEHNPDGSFAPGGPGSR